MNEKTHLQDIGLQAFIWVFIVYFAGMLQPLIDEIQVLFHPVKGVVFGDLIYKSCGLLFISASIATGTFLNYIYKVKTKNINHRVIHVVVFIIVLLSVIITYNNIKGDELNVGFKTVQLSVFLFSVLFVF